MPTSLSALIAERGLHLQKLASNSKRVLGGCREWSLARTEEGYGKFAHGGAWLLAHRVSWACANEQDPGTLLVLHDCDNPPCIDPSHLFLGDHHDNSIDAARKGKHSRAVLTHARVEEARILRSAGLSYRAIAEKLDVNPVTVWNIIKGNTWNHAESHQG
jgi:DNA-binding CsgD family transcriptional regulator